MFVINATDYAPIDPLTPPCDVNQINIGYVGENHARCLVFDLTECVAQFGEGGFAISFIRHGDYLPYLVTDTDRLENNAIWLINSTDTAVEGYGMVQLQYIVGTTVVKSALYQTVTFASNEIPGNVPDPYEDLLAQIAAYAAQAEGAATTATAAAQTASTAVEEGIKTERSQRIAADNGLQEQITAIRGAVGAPAMASSSTDFVETNKIYVYTGNEPGYTFGNWYYYNGAEWVSGGVYNATAFETDKTLTVEDMAADAKVTGDRINAAFVTEQTSGSIASFADGADNVPVKDLVVNITAVQAGSDDPSPTNIRRIFPFDSASIYVSKENLWGGSALVNSISKVNATASVSGDTITYRANGFSTNVITTPVLVNGFKPNTRYTVVYAFSNTTGTTVNTNIAFVYTDGTMGQMRVSSGEADTKYTVTFTSESGKTIDYIRGLYNGGTTTAYYNECGLFEGVVTVDDFVPYDGNNYNISFGAVGTVYGGTLDITTGMLTATYYGVDLGALTWSRIDDTYFRAIVENGYMVSGGQRNAICSSYTRYIGSSSAFKQTDSRVWVAPTNISSTISYVCVTDSRYTDAASFKTAVTGQTLVYELAQPVSYQLTPTEVIKSLLGNNNIWSDTGSVASCEYRADTKLYLEKLTNPDDDMVANANITSGSYFMVGNNLYLATANIANGGAITPGTNCTATNLAAALNAINS